MNAPRLRLVATASILALATAACLPGDAPTEPPGVRPGSSPIALASEAPSAAPAATPARSAAQTPIAPPAPTDTPDPTNPPELSPTPPPSPIPGCGTGEAGFRADRSEIPKALSFGHATIEFTSAGVGMRDGTWVVDDVIPDGIGLTPNEIAVRVHPGTHIILRGAGVALTATSARVVPWSTVRFEGGLGVASADPVDLSWRLRADGSISVSAPQASGDYMVAFGPIWRTTCLQGDGTAFSRIKVDTL